jgi:hypothetical protein
MQNPPVSDFREHNRRCHISHPILHYSLAEMEKKRRQVPRDCHREEPNNYEYDAVEDDLLVGSHDIDRKSDFIVVVG